MHRSSERVVVDQVVVSVTTASLPPAIAAMTTALSSGSIDGLYEVHV
jgi:hypothetical protein